VRIRFGDRTVLDGASLMVPARSTCALLGASGAGKTTLLRIVAGLTAPDAGEVRIGGRTVLDMRPERRRVAMVFQEPRLFPALSVAENVAYGLRARGVRRAERLARTRALVADVGLVDRSGDRPEALSGGQQQRVALARALAAEPEVLLLDEPLSAVDGPVRTELRALIRSQVASRPTTTVVVTHDLADATALGDRVAVLDGGRILQCSDATTLFDRPACPGVAALCGNPNVVVAPVRAGRVTLGSLTVAVAGPDGPARFTVRPEHLCLGDPTGTLSRVTSVERRAAEVRVQLSGLLGQLEAVVPAGSAPSVGDDVCVGVPAERLWRFPEPAGRDNG
jgi:putative spermidine/putrescine transport system ATP-binding protein